jgi:hypothetical protein
MRLDVRVPIGLLFLTLGTLLVAFGVTSDPRIYEEHSLGININRDWGGVLLIFGAANLVLAWRASAAARMGQAR